MSKEYVLYGRKSNEPEWKEQIITEGAAEKCNAAEQWARTQGFTEFRRSEIDNSLPDFVGAIDEDLLDDDFIKQIPEF